MTNQNIKDSDADGLLDSVEKRRKTNPLKADSDGDGLNDYEELNVYGTNPLKRDTDDDGMSDGDEIKRGRNPFGAGQLKDLFIPYEGNNYQPEALNPYRILFYSITSIGIKIFVIAVIFMFPLSALLVPDILNDQSQKIVDLTNEVRAKAGVPPLRENETLDQAAVKKVEDMLAHQYFSHQGPDDRAVSDWLSSVGYRYLVAGENLAMGFATPEEVVDGWTKSKTHYTNMIDADFNEIGIGLSVGRYNNIETTVVAQYFGRPSGEQMIILQPLSAQAKRVTASSSVAGLESKKTQVLGVKEYASDLAVDSERSKLYLKDDSAGRGKIASAIVYLGRDVEQAQVNLGGYEIDLKRDANDLSKWTGDILIFKENFDKVLSPLVLPVLSLSDSDGNVLDIDLDWDQAPVSRPSLFREYSLLKQYKAFDLGNLFLVSTLYYKVLLFLALIALALNTFIEIKRQYPRMIFSALGFIILLIILIIV
ncbi:MAG: hypothetical protein COX02_00670 [Candidatus Vogelbacteria bacterium CG22_combo_CG10-13_8_21_14_all_37_9]|uniref:SCP domain-containing protein n=1 Tax=Candidatus Vogelbacteria bacterium CG22_combo_CG10-13_8_21_14_all_37_9 TaxID=1975046 RepID=A0A2H0BKZ9_9BACT|nr:MAG: hypothetical protein BK005_00590 [bacterium CG10_37_50]PIP58355.1 MAG: hypothetical protein COX02_00670 [Candidatus Vogelbacteria bacterium CG22_combo_CG10-13_8_21_14_all_37_9]